MAHGISGPGRSWLVALLTALALVAGGCSSDDGGDGNGDGAAQPTTGSETPSESGTPAPSDAVCAALRDLESSAKGIGGTSLDAFRSGLDEVQQSLEDLRAALGTEYSDEVDAVSAALDDFRTELADVSGQPSRAGLKRLRQATSDLVDAASALDLRIDCPAQ